MTAPLALFVYARPAHTRRTVESLLRNRFASETDLIVFSDAARTLDKAESVHLVREYVANIVGFRSLTVHHRPQNFGLAKSIVEGVTQVLTEHERVIVLEDDLVTSPYFLHYMNEALDRFAEEDRVISVHGYVYPVHKPLPEAFFLRGADCWGWATWRRGWAQFNPDGQFLLNELKRQHLLKLFDFNGAYSYSEMLKDQINGLNDSWAVRWHASAFLANKLTLYPGRSLTHNIGNDSTGRHCGTSTALDAELSATPIRLDSAVIEESETARQSIEDFFRMKRSPLQRMLRRSMPRNMRQRMSAIAKDWLPPLLARQLRRFSHLGRGMTFEGPFATWDEAMNHSTGYDSDQILERVLSATLKVKHGKAVFERDAVLFEEIQYSWPITSGLLLTAAREGGRLSVLDFGGSLGSIYYQNRKFLQGLSDLRWSVVEQPHFVEAGRKLIQDDQLKFYPTIAQCVDAEKPNVVLLSSVIQYLEDPYAVLDELMRSGVGTILVDRTSFHDGENDLIAVQKVGDSIYPASYPLRILSKQNIINYLSESYDLLAEWLSPEGFVGFSPTQFSFNGFSMQRKGL